MELKVLVMHGVIYEAASFRWYGLKPSFEGALLLRFLRVLEISSTEKG